MCLLESFFLSEARESQGWPVALSPILGLFSPVRLLKARRSHSEAGLPSSLSLDSFPHGPVSGIAQFQVASDRLLSEALGQTLLVLVLLNVFLLPPED